MFGVKKESYIPDVVREWLPDLAAQFNKKNVELANFIGPNFINKFNLTCMAIGIVAVLLLIVFQVIRTIRQHKLGIKQNIIGTIISTLLISAVILFITFKLSCFRGFPMLLLWLIAVIGIYGYVTNKTAFGRHLYAVGGNEKAAALSGVKTRNVFWFAYANMGLLAGLAGAVVAGTGSGIDPTIGEAYEMDAIAACFIGGASAYGGTGKVSGMIIGALLMGIINKGMVIMDTSVNITTIIKGLVLLVAVMFDVLTKKNDK